MIDKVVNSGGKEEVNSLDGKYKATPLHWARSKDDITQLVNFGATLEQKSFTDDRQTGLKLTYRGVGRVSARLGQKINFAENWWRGVFWGVVYEFSIEIAL